MGEGESLEQRSESSATGIACCRHVLIGLKPAALVTGVGTWGGGVPALCLRGPLGSVALPELEVLPERLALTASAYEATAQVAVLGAVAVRAGAGAWVGDGWSLWAARGDCSGLAVSGSERRGEVLELRGDWGCRPNVAGVGTGDGGGHEGDHTSRASGRMGLAELGQQTKSQVRGGEGITGSSVWGGLSRAISSWCGVQTWLNRSVSPPIGDTPDPAKQGAKLLSRSSGSAQSTAEEGREGRTAGGMAAGPQRAGLELASGTGGGWNDGIASPAPGCWTSHGSRGGPLASGGVRALGRSLGIRPGGCRLVPIRTGRHRKQSEELESPDAAFAGLAGRLDMLKDRAQRHPTGGEGNRAGGLRLRWSQRGPRGQEAASQRARGVCVGEIARYHNI